MPDIPIESFFDASENRWLSRTVAFAAKVCHSVVQCVEGF